MILCRLPPVSYLRFVPLDGAVKHMAHHTAGKKKEQPSFLQEMPIGLPFVSTVIWLVLPCQKRDAQSASVHGMSTPVYVAFLLVKKEKSETKGESLLRCCA